MAGGGVCWRSGCFLSLFFFKRRAVWVGKGEAVLARDFSKGRPSGDTGLLGMLGGLLLPLGLPSPFLDFPRWWQLLTPTGCSAAVAVGEARWGRGEHRGPGACWDGGLALELLLSLGTKAAPSSRGPSPAAERGGRSQLRETKISAAGRFLEESLATPFPLGLFSDSKLLPIAALPPQEKVVSPRWEAASVFLCT